MNEATIINNAILLGEAMNENKNTSIQEVNLLGMLNLTSNLYIDFNFETDIEFNFKSKFIKGYSPIALIFLTSIC